MARFWYSRTHREVEIPDDIAHEYEGRKRYTRLDIPDDVPDGTISEVLAWVGDDIVRAEAALQVELEGRRRKTLVDALDQIGV